MEHLSPGQNGPYLDKRYADITMGKDPSRPLVGLSLPEYNGPCHRW